MRLISSALLGSLLLKLLLAPVQPRVLGDVLVLRLVGGRHAVLPISYRYSSSSGYESHRE
jgi:hypothetical protein